jgi:hypothetical protein
VKLALASVALVACSFARPSSHEPKSNADCRVWPPALDTGIAAAIAAVAVVAATSKCLTNCDFIESGAALPIAALSASFVAGATYGYIGYGRCRATVAAAAQP